MKKTVVITRPSGPYAGARKLADKLAQKGFTPLEFPVLACVPEELSQETRSAIVEILKSPGVWIAFLSPTAVYVFRDLMMRVLENSRSMADVRIAVQGKGTAEAVVECFNRKPDFVPSIFIAEEFAKEFAPRVKKGERVLIPQSSEGRDLLAPALQSAGKSAWSFSLYRLESVAVDPQRIKFLKELPGEVTVVVFMSPSAVRAAVEHANEILVGKRMLSVGPITSQAIRKAGLPIWREAREHSEDGVLAALIDGEGR